MSKADKLLEECGFKLVGNSYINKNDGRVMFKNKQVHIHHYHEIDKQMIGVSFHVAIHEKLKELGWFD